MTAAVGATMQQTFGDRLLLGFARGLFGVNDNHGMLRPSMAAFGDYCDILLRVWNGETVEYDGPLGRFPRMSLVDPLTEPRPQFILSSWAPGPKATALAAKYFDGVFLGSELTAEAVGNVLRRLRGECERIGRDPQSLKVYAIAAPDLSPELENAIVNARIITHLGFPYVGDLIMRENGWDPEPMRRILGQDDPQGGQIVDQKFHREDLLEMGARLPREWVETGCIVGPAKECASRLADYFDAGTDHIVLHGCGPNEVAGMLEEWRLR